MKKRILFLVLFSICLFSCKVAGKLDNTGSFAIINYSDKVIEFVWIAPQGEFYPTARELNIKYGESYEITGLAAGIYDIAIDFKNEFNYFNSKLDKSLCLKIEKGIKKVWIVDSKGNILRN
ncbi:MAG TPA: hypothetical protein PLE45_06355 [Spirochaetota bacterium]|nr:hypothetical protein [Spirochaetota bacterium]HOL56881.1 hypothetical protein [Spirochaetota bacterium]HPP04295.1 hypothetical protein [Spirochaetota bacterium]